MRLFVRPRLVLPIAVLAGVLAGCGGTSTSATEPTPTVTTPAPTPTHPLPSLAVMLGEKALGSATAPITMIEYSSLTCSHCGDFDVITFPLIKSAYIDTGQVRFIARDFPLNDAATGAAMVARCSGDRYFTVVDTLFRSQSSWAFSSDWKSPLKQLVAPLGMTGDDVEACLTQQDLKSGILDIKQGGFTSYGVSATPTFIINNLKVVGALTFAEFDAVLRSFQ